MMKKTAVALYGPIVNSALKGELCAIVYSMHVFFIIAYSLFHLHAWCLQRSECQNLPTGVSTYPVTVLSANMNAPPETK